MAGSLPGIPLSQQFDANGSPLRGALLYIYAANTTTPQDSFLDSGLTIKNPWPLQADATGRLPMLYLADGAVHVRLTDSTIRQSVDRQEAPQRFLAQELSVLRLMAISSRSVVPARLYLGMEECFRSRAPVPFDERRIAEAREVLAACGELEIGRRIQAGFFPDVLPQPAGWDLAAHFASAREVAGDFYDAFALPGDRVALVVGDVCDKGVGAALFMALFRSLFRAIAEQRFSAECDPSDALHTTLAATNDYIARTHGNANMFATVFFAVLDARAGSLRYINAGHEAPTILRPGGDVRMRLVRTGPAVGMFPDAPFDVAHASLHPGETLFAFTDGVIDMRNGSGSEFSEPHLLELLNSPASSASALLTRVQNALIAHAAGEPAFDDVTMLALRCEAVA